MARVALDSNVLVYAALEPQTEKGQLSRRIVKRAAPRGVLAVQALLEFVAVVRRRAPAMVEAAVVQAEAWAGTFETAPTTDRVLAEAMTIVRAHGFQVWDAVIWAAARQAGAGVLLTEDLQHGFQKDGLRALNPYALETAEVASLFD